MNPSGNVAAKELELVNTMMAARRKLDERLE